MAWKCLQKTSTHQKTQRYAFLEAHIEIPEKGHGQKGEADIDEDVPTCVQGQEIQCMGAKVDLLEVKMVTFVMIVGSQQFAVIKMFHSPSVGVHAANSKIEFNMLTRNVETIVNHTNRFRQ